MPNSRVHREKQRKKTRYSRYSSDSDSEREKSRRHREKSREKSRSKVKDRRSRDRNERSSSSRHKDRRRRYSSSSSSSSDSSRSSSRNSRSSSSDRDKPSKSTSISKKNFDHITKFEINDLYKEEEKGKILGDIEADSFKQETFQSKKKIVVDLKKDTVMVPEMLAPAEEESLIHPSFLGDDEAKVDKWIKKLYLYRNQ